MFPSDTALNDYILLKIASSHFKMIIDSIIAIVKTGQQITRLVLIYNDDVTIEYGIRHTRDGYYNNTPSKPDMERIVCFG